MKRTFLFLLLTVSLFASCIQDEAPNAEADIVSCSLQGADFFRQPVIGNDSVTIFVPFGTDLNNLTLSFELTPGATISPESGSRLRLDDNNIAQYTVTSEDRKWNKVYKVKVLVNSPLTDMLTEFHFEGVELKKQGTTDYQVIKELDSNGSTLLEWGSGNQGYTMAAQADGINDPTKFPTVSSSQGYQGKCVVLTTCAPKAEQIARLAPIAAGNLFIGNFGTINLAQPALSTHFGEGFIATKVPISLEGYYKFKKGSKFTVTNPQAGTDYNTFHDAWDVYGVLYEYSHDKPYLDGYNILTDASIVAIARLPRSERMEDKSEWTHFFMEFQLQNGKTIDKTRLKQGAYNLAIVMSSSEEGAYFNGAEGSTLQVDEVKLNCEEEEDNK